MIANTRIGSSLMSLIKSAIKGGLWTAGTRYPSFVYNLISNLILSRLLAPHDFGIFALAFSVADFLVLLGDMGIGRATIQLQDEPSIIDTSFLLSLLWTAIILLVSGTILYSISGFYDSLTIKATVILFIVKTAHITSSIYLAKLDAELAFTRSALIESLSQICATTMAIILALTGFGLWCLIMREITATATTYLFAFALAQYRAGFNFNIKTAKKILHLSLNLLTISMGERLIAQLPKFAIGTFTGARWLGPFERSLYLTNLPSRIFTQLYGQIAYAVFAKTQHEPRKIGKGLEWSLLFTFRVMTLGSLITLLYPKWLLTTVLGSQWAFGAVFLRGLALYLLARPVHLALQSGILATGKTKALIYATGANLSVILASCLGCYAIDNWYLLAWGVSIGSLASCSILAFFCYVMAFEINWLKVLYAPIVLAPLTLAFYVFFGSAMPSVMAIFVISLLWTGGCLGLEQHHYRYFWGLLRAD